MLSPPHATAFLFCSKGKHAGKFNTETTKHVCQSLVCPCLPPILMLLPMKAALTLQVEGWNVDSERIHMLEAGKPFTLPEIDAAA